MKYVIYRRACDWQCEETDKDWDGWVRGLEYRDREAANLSLKQLRKEDPESSFKVVVE